MKRFGYDIDILLPERIGGKFILETRSSVSGAVASCYKCFCRVHPDYDEFATNYLKSQHAVSKSPAFGPWVG